LRRAHLLGGGRRTGGHGRADPDGRGAGAGRSRLHPGTPAGPRLRRGSDGRGEPSGPGGGGAGGALVYRPGQPDQQRPLPAGRVSARRGPGGPDLPPPPPPPPTPGRGESRGGGGGGGGGRGGGGGAPAAGRGRAAASRGRIAASGGRIGGDDQLHVGGPDAFLLAGEQGHGADVGRGRAVHIQGPWPQVGVPDGGDLGRVDQRLA